MTHLMSFVIFIALVSFSPVCFSAKTNNGYLYPQFYDRSCPKAREIVNYVVAKAVAKEPCMAASLIRLHFHDCFVKECDGSILLDSTETMLSEKRPNPNRNSACGFEVIEEIKYELEKACPTTISCSDILALAASTTRNMRICDEKFSDESLFVTKSHL